MGRLDGKVAIVTGAGRGVGREHALALAAEGAAVVVNDLGGSTTGEGSDLAPAAEVVSAIRAAGGRAVANGSNVANWESAGELVVQAIDEFGHLDILVNNAGILRDKSIANMTEEEWDPVVAVHLKGHGATLHHACAYWRDRSKAGEPVDAAVVNTTSVSGILGQFGQTNYGAAKAGIAALTVIAQLEMERYGVRVNCIAPYARTRLIGNAPPSSDGFDALDPANIAPFVVYLASPGCPMKGKVFFVHGGKVQLARPWRLAETIAKEGRWTVDELFAAAAPFAEIDLAPVMPA
jgi:NAD(P)-dependent dehydrogenase (short-subunit alcohol dehydrogenase family)